ncbi:hypothetical protein L228DRAFT_263722 [Xylona heveae TC161]|uniref:Uncharacterized protein n=1 Tax=Xylona heveae (strain CBS 132557 / TC161) TaxID=1328760 RepID=A0A164ZQQ9_XYLHT|nr:hypothetical protein L228DRAFT_263722 [Xylona heveae TC161]KZF19388.1 hypothetical protein L228DRAFT_263722 [Xylona heveae TC161]
MSAGMSNVGGRGTYEAGDQRNAPASAIKTAERYEEGQVHSHSTLDSKDERSIANKLASESKSGPGKEPKEVSETKKDSTLPARNHGNEPSKGAKIDQELKEEEEAAVSKKGGFGSKAQ